MRCFLFNFEECWDAWKSVRGSYNRAYLRRTGGHIERLLCGIRNIICKNREAGTMFLASLSLLGYFFWNRWLCSASNQAVICSRVTVLPTLYMKVSLPAITLRAYEEVWYTLFFWLKSPIEWAVLVGSLWTRPGFNERAQFTLDGAMIVAL